MDSCVCMAESFCYLPDTVTTLFVNWSYPSTKAKVKKNWGDDDNRTTTAAMTNHNNMIKGYTCRDYIRKRT